MPMIELLVSHGALDTEAASHLQTSLGRIAMKWEKTPDTAFYRTLTWVHITQATPESFQAVQPGKPCFRIDVSIPAGILSPADREGLVSDLTAETLRAARLPAEDARQVWVFINETPNGALGIGGDIVHLADITARLAAEIARRHTSTTLPVVLSGSAQFNGRPPTH